MVPGSKLSAGDVIALWEEHFQRKGREWLRVLSGSMAPFLNVDDEVLVERAEPVNIGRGDVIVFRNRGKLETHRVIKVFRKNGTSFLQKGDNVLNAAIVRGEQLIGKVVAVKKPGKTIMFSSKKGKAINFILTLFSISTYYLAQKKSLPSKFALPALNKMKKVFLYGLKKGVF